MNKEYRGMKLEEYAGEEIHNTCCDVRQCYATEGPFETHGGFCFCPAHLAHVKSFDAPALALVEVHYCPPQPIMPVDQERQRRFASHIMDEEQVMRADEIRHICLALSERIAHLVPPGREQATALTNLEQVMFFSVAGIARETV